MNWLKNVLIDLAVTALIAWAVFAEASWARWIILIYTPLMLLLKIVAAFSGTLAQLNRKSDAAPPGWFFHVLYLANVVLLAVGQWWMLVALWVAIWILSVIAERRSISTIKAK